MQKLILPLFILLFAQFTFADKVGTADGVPAMPPSAPCKQEIKCSEEPDGQDDVYIINQVEKAKDCDAAAEAVENCGFGTTKDNATTSAAVAKCDKEAGKLNGADKAMKEAMKNRCKKICNPKGGTECLSSIYFCNLKVSKFIAGLKRY